VLFVAESLTQLVESDIGEQKYTPGYVLPEGVDVHEGEAVVEGAQNQCAEQGAGDRAAAARFELSMRRCSWISVFPNDDGGYLPGQT
jgi:hypothetical protein